ncbi:hypothetical protein EVAR_100190_1 [Eumeta japonica]|uniref:Uncharacterized protein n=1 Tax=Eumeta variegata TaxID=151549 RepID=A0A4C2ABJ4_EUMVA|nr:hypothetical protein EVAR_100190_1 [Eumeta japonica]
MGVAPRNSHPLEEVQQRKLLLQDCIMRECGTSAFEPDHFRTTTMLATAWIYRISSIQFERSPHSWLHLYNTTDRLCVCVVENVSLSNTSLQFL